MNYSKQLLTIFIVTLLSIRVHAQNKPFSFYGNLEMWSRYTSLNPGSTINGEAENYAWDFSIRRYRLGVKGSATEHLRYHIQLGNNNLNPNDISKKDIPPKLLDAYIEYDVNKYLTLVAGKHAFVGLTRWASPSTFSGIGTDTNYAGTPFLNQQDDFFRRMGVALKGQINKVDYRVLVAKPFSVDPSKIKLGENASFINDANAIHTSAYVKYQFLDMESQGSAFAPWTYHGKKQLFNIGTGFWYQTKSTGTVDNAGDTLTHDAISFALDLFYERTHSSGKTWTFSAAYIHHDLGPNFIRNIGANNAANGSNASASFNGKGNSFPTVGTGEILLGHAGLLIPFENDKGEKVGLQPYFIYELGLFEALDDPMIWNEFGVNYLLNSHQSKITLGYQNRPIFIKNGDQIESDHHEGLVVLQYEVRFK